MSKIATLLQVGRSFGMRDGILRLEYELQRGSGLMLWKMRSVQGWESWELRKIAPNFSPEEMREARRNGAPKFFFINVQSLGTSIAKTIGAEGRESALAEAERILAGTLPFFGDLPLSSGFPPQWFQNPVTGQTVSPRQPWTQMRFASPVYGDLKFILEPSRFLFIYPLIRAYTLSGDERYPQAFWSALEDWARQNPPMAGPLWICGQECSLRIMAWSFALHAFIHSPSTTTARVGLLVSMIASHAWRIAQTLGYARSQRSNHLISEAVGLWTAGSLYPELREAPVWRNLGAQLLREAVLDQISPQGVSQQHSFNYQRMILHLLLWTLRLAEIQDIPLRHDIRERGQVAFDFLRQWVDPTSGLAPSYGSDDGSLILPLAPATYRDYRPLLQLGAAVFDRPALPPGPWDEASQWFGVKPRALGNTSTLSQTSSDSGYFRLGDELSWALIRAGRYTRRPFQADQLHVDLWWQGINIARDAGTYLYNGPAPWNNALAGTAVHNTVMVDHRDQMRRTGRFLWVDWAQATGRLFSSPEQPYADRFEGEHDGYRDIGVTHYRRVQWLAGAGWIIVDDIVGEDMHDVRLHWLTPDFPHDMVRQPFQVAFACGPSRIRWNIFSRSPGTAAVVRAGVPTDKSSAKQFADADVELLGWESLTYGDLRPAISLVYDVRSRLPLRLVTVVLTDVRCRVESNDDQLMILRDDSHRHSEVYRVNLSPRGKDASMTSISAVSVKKA